MSFGKPAIPTPNAVDLRALQTAVSNTRQRIEALESALVTVQNTVGVSTTSNTAAQIATLSSQLTALAAEVTALEGATVTAPDDASLTIAQRSFAPPAPPPAPPAYDGQNLLAQRAFDVVRAAAPIDVGQGLMQGRVFAQPHPPTPADDTLFASRIFDPVRATPGAPVTAAPSVDDASVQIANRSFFPPTVTPGAPASGSSTAVDDASLQIAARSFFPPATPPAPVPYDAQNLLAQRSFDVVRTIPGAASSSGGSGTSADETLLWMST